MWWPECRRLSRDCQAQSRAIFREPRHGRKIAPKSVIHMALTEGFVHPSPLEYSSAWMSFGVEWPVG